MNREAMLIQKMAREEEELKALGAIESLNISSQIAHLDQNSIGFKLLYLCLICHYIALEGNHH